MGNIKPTLEQTEKARQIFTQKSKVYFEALQRIIGNKKPVITYDLTSGKCSIDYGEETTQEKILKQRIDDIRFQCQTDILTY